MARKDAAAGEKEDRRDAEDIMMEMANIPMDIRRRAVALRRNMSGFETKVWKLLGKEENPWGFLRQWPMSGYYLDFYTEHFNVALEADGPDHLRRVKTDRKRDQVLMKAGVRTIRITPADFVKSSAGDMIEYLTNAIENFGED